MSKHESEKQGQWVIRDVDSDRTWPKETKAEVESALEVFGDELTLEVEPPEGVERADIEDGELVIQGGESAERGENSQDSTEKDTPNETQAVEPVDQEPQQRPTQRDTEGLDDQVLDEAMQEAEELAKGMNQPLNNPLATLPDWMLTEIQHGRDTSLDLNKDGSQVIANALDLAVSAECEVSAKETDFEYCRYRATVETPDGKTYNAVGDVRIDETGKNHNKWDLERKAETRAKKRAVKWATGGGIEAFREYGDSDA